MNTIISATEFIKNVKNTVCLFKKIWKEHTTMLLHAPQNVDKTRLALNIASEAIAKGHKIVYVNTSSALSDYVEMFSELPDLAVLSPTYDLSGETNDYADIVIESIEKAIETTGIRTYIIDSVNRIAALSFGRNASAAFVMKRLVALQIRTGCSFLIISHDSTKSTDRALLTLADSELKIESEKEEAAVSQTEEMPSLHDESQLTFDNEINPVASDNTQSRPKSLSRRERRILRRATQTSRKQKH